MKGSYDDPRYIWPGHPAKLFQRWDDENLFSYSNILNEGYNIQISILPVKAKKYQLINLTVLSITALFHILILPKMLQICF